MPEAGGLRDQPAGELDRMTWAYMVWRAVREYKAANKQGKAQQWIKANPELYDLKLMVDKIK